MELSHIIKVFRNLDKIDVVIIGYGRMGKRHFKELSQNNYFNIIGIIDPYVKDIPENTKIIDNIKSAYELGAVAAIISTPTLDHNIVIKECLKYNLNILVEKPALIDRKDYLEILDLSKENICVGMVERYNDKLHYLRTRTR